MIVAGWDIGGVNTKAARVAQGRVEAACTYPFELQRGPAALAPLLRDLAGRLNADADAHAVTMTAELSQMFRTKREGVHFVLDAVDEAFPHAAVGIYTTGGSFLTIAEARHVPLEVAAANWVATATEVARRCRTALLVDVGTTTTDIIPIVDGGVVAAGFTDPERLASGELVYTGALRTPAETMASKVPSAHGLAGVSTEGFALAGDVHLWRGDLRPADYSVPTPDGRPAERQFAGERLARMICADREMLDEQGIDAIAAALAEGQMAQIVAAIQQVLTRHRSLDTAIVTGLGAFLAASAARMAGLRVVSLSDHLGEDAARCAPAAAVALLFERAHSHAAYARRSPAVARPRHLDAVIKIGGSLLSHPRHLRDVLDVLRQSSRSHRVVAVPGGGVFADAVRAIDGRYGLSDDAAHWMAILGMDQYAHGLASLAPDARVVRSPEEIARALEARQLPILAPSDWLQRADPLPHSWDVTSDSIAAWFAGHLGAPRLVLVKAPAARESLLDAFFARVTPPALSVTLVAADDLDGVRAALSGSARGSTVPHEI